MKLSLVWIVAFSALGPWPQARGVDEAVSAAVARGDAADEQLKTAESLQAYLLAEKLGDKDPDLWRKIAREYSLSMADTTSKTELRVLGDKALEYARRAVTADPHCASCQLALAICYGRVAPLLDNQTKISYSRLVKQHVDIALKLDPSQDYAYHVLGAWHYELAGLNPVLRALAGLIYGAVPSASYEEAIRNFKKAIELAPQRPSHHLELGRTYAALGQKDLARAELNKGLSMPNREKDDPWTKERARVTLSRL